MLGGSHRRERKRRNMASPSPDTLGSGDREGLTYTPPRIHCAATQEGECRNAVSETDRIILEHFFDTLAKVAISVAKRRIREQGG